MTCYKFFPLRGTMNYQSIVQRVVYGLLRNRGKDGNEMCSIFKVYTLTK